MRKIVYWAFLCFFFSCENNTEFADIKSATNSINESVTVLKERDSKYPLEFPQRTLTRNYVNLSSETNNYLGYSYKLNKFPLGTALNLGSPIIDAPKMDREEPYYVNDNDVNIQDINTFSYSTFDRYTYKSKDTEKVTSGFSLNVKLFSFGNKQTIENIYTQNIANESQRVFGQLDAFVWGRRYNIAISSNSLNKIKLRYLNKTFIEEIHSITTREFIDIYGPFILTDYFTGGKLTAIYSGTYIGNDETNTKERNIDMDIKASYGGKQEINGEANIGIGSKYYREEMTSKKISNMQVSIKAIGGNLSYASFTSPQNISNVNIDLSSWMRSLTPETYSMVDISEGGLIPLSEVVMERNLKQHIREYLEFGNKSSEQIQEPYIEILRREIQGFRLLIPILYTKNGDGVAICGAEALDPADSESTIERKIQEIKNEKAKIYGLKIVTSTCVNDTIPIIPKDWVYDIGMIDPKSERDIFAKYIDEENNILYLLYDRRNAYTAISNESPLLQKMRNRGLRFTTKEKNNRTYYGYAPIVGWSFYNYKRALNLYGLKEFVDSLPEITLDPEDLLECDLIAF